MTLFCNNYVAKGDFMRRDVEQELLNWKKKKVRTPLIIRVQGKLAKAIQSKLSEESIFKTRLLSTSKKRPQLNLPLKLLMFPTF